MSATTVNVQMRVRNRWIARLPRPLVRLLARYIRVETRVGNGTWKTYGTFGRPVS